MIDLKYINADGFVVANPYNQSEYGEGNGILNTGVAYLCGIYEPDVAEMWRKCGGKLDLPLFYRSPQKKNPGDNETCDDYWAMLAMAHYLSPVISRQLYYYGFNNGWVYNVEHPEDKTDIRFYFARFPAFIPFAKLCAGIRLSSWDRFKLAAVVLWDAFHLSDADGNKKAFCRARVCSIYPGILVWASRLWFKRIRARYGGLGKSWADSLCSSHPLCEVE